VPSLHALRFASGVRACGATYPVAYEYDAHGRMTAMATTRDSAADFATLAAELAQGASLASLASTMSLDLTTWFYDEATGLLTNKVYADGKGTAYTYTSDGQLASRIWARGVTTAYAYDLSGSLTNIDYSDSTPDVAFIYDRLGRMVSAIVAGISTNAYTYDPETLALTAETQNGMEIDRTTDALGRDTGFSLPGSPYAVQYAYDAYGRFHSVTSSITSITSITSTFTYSYLPNTDLLSGMTASSGFLWTRAYESGRSLITSVENRYGETVISRYDYENDALGRRVSRADSGLAFANPAFDAYSYNGRSEVTGAQRYHGTDVSDTATVYGGRQFGYAYDPIGNRTAASETIGGETLAKAYTANALNQYTAIANPGAVGLRGDATNTAAVTVNDSAVQSDDITSDTIPWHFALEADNGSGPDFPFAEIVAVINPPGTNTPDIVSTSSGHLYAPPQNETLTYDDDGNLLSDGRWQYIWNGENRLIKAEELVSPTNRQPHVVEYAYDHRGRMIWKTIAPSTAPPIKTISYFWDDYNIISEHETSGAKTDITYNVWGIDLSGSLQGAGGVGGLLAVGKDGGTFAPAFDANGNVTEYLSADGTIAAHYEYSPFGEIVVRSAPLADSFTHRFSTKPWCSVTGLSEYEFRKYDAAMGRWMRRDPIGEMDSGNLYAFTLNMPIFAVDKLGLKKTLQCHSWEPANFGPPEDIAIGTKFGPVDISASFGLGVAGEMCSVCCDDGTKANDYTVSLSAYGSLEISGSSWGGGVDLGGISGSVWVGVKGSLFAKGSAAISLTSDGCSGGCGVGQLCLQVEAGGSLALGGNLTYKIGWWEQSLGVYGEVTGTSYIQKCWDCTLCDGRLACDAQPTKRCFKAQGTLHVNMAFNHYSWIFWQTDTCD
jgi:RHS repeat-associated protein